MGWSVIISDPENEIWDCEIEEIVKELPDCWRKFIPKGETMEQPYGFPAYGNISHPTKEGVEITGSYITTSAVDVEKFLYYISKELKAYNHEKLQLKNNRETDLFHLNDTCQRIEKRLEEKENDS